MTPALRFPIRYSGANRAMVVLGMTRRGSYVDVGDDDIVVRMSWAFRARFPRAHVVSARDNDCRIWGWGVHGWRGDWLVNGSSKGVVRIDLSPTAKARVLGVPVKLRTLRVSVDDPAGLVDCLAPAGAPDAT